MKTVVLHTPHFQTITHPLFEKLGVEVVVKREDGLHPLVGGNKWYKLKYNLETAIANNYNTVLTFGGAFSNHIAATAAACNQIGIKAIGVIRGEATSANNPTLTAARDAGMLLHFVSREAYRKATDLSFLEALEATFGAFYTIPEGGANALGVKGCTEIVTEQTKSFTHLVLASGTGTTAAGLLQACQSEQEVIAIPVFKNGHFLKDAINGFAHSKKSIQLFPEYGFGGYAKTNAELISFINYWNSQRLPLDPIYTGKAFFGLFDKIATGYFPRKSKVLFIHTGGLQGIAGYNQQQLRKHPNGLQIHYNTITTEIHN